MLMRTLAALGATAALAVPAMAQDIDMPFALDWKFEGPAAHYFVAVDKGYFADAGLAIPLVTAPGSCFADTGHPARAGAGRWLRARAPLPARAQLPAR